MAATDDPHAIDRRLRTAIDQHLEVLAGRPPDPTPQLNAARRALIAAEQRQAEAAAVHRRLTSELKGMSRRSGLTRHGRTSRLLLSIDVCDMAGRVDQASAAIATARSTLAAVELQAESRRNWDRTDGWRSAAVDDLRRQLADHWTATVLACARADDPLAHGISRLRAAHHHTARLHRAAARQAEPDPVEVRRLGDDRALIAAALDHTLDARIIDLADNPTPWYQQHLGPAPAPGTRRDVWCAYALRIEAAADTGYPDPAETVRLARQGHNHVQAVAHLQPETDGRLQGRARWTERATATTPIALAQQRQAQQADLDIGR